MGNRYEKTYFIHKNSLSGPISRLVAANCSEPKSFPQSCPSLWRNFRFPRPLRFSRENQSSRVGATLAVAHRCQRHRKRPHQIRRTSPKSPRHCEEPTGDVAIPSFFRGVPCTTGLPRPYGPRNDVVVGVWSSFFPARSSKRVGNSPNCPGERGSPLRFSQESSP